jgi:predicted nuclease of predicted toxin-antitoxin system
VRLLTDSNIVAQAVEALRAAGHDVVYLGERTADQALLAEAVDEGRIILTKDMISVFWFIVIDNRTVAYCCWTIWLMRRPNPA